MRIALTVDPEIPTPPVHYGGIERIVDMLARGLAARGHEVTLFANPASTCLVKVVGWPGASSVSARDSLRNMATLARHCAAGGVDIVHSFSRIAYLAPLLPLPILKLMSYQRAISPRTTALAHRLARGSLEFSAISRCMIDHAPLAGRWRLVPNGVPLDAFIFQPRVADDAPLLFLGRIEEIKGPHLAIAAARRAGMRLVIAGNVPDAHRGWFDTHVRPHVDGDRVTYVGPVDDAQKNTLLGQARAFLMPILWDEPFGIVMAEAMACGTPVIGLARGAVPEVVAHGVTGFVVDTLDDMVASIARAPLIDRAACRARVEALYSDHAVVEGYLAVYAAMLARRSG